MNHTQTDVSPSGPTGADKRRSTRVEHVTRIVVRGKDALSQDFRETTTTVMVNCSGCQYQSKNYVPKNSIVTVEIPRENMALSPRILRARVVWVQRPRTYRHLFLIGIEFDVGGNVWGVSSPPKDWFPHPEDEELVIPVSQETAAPGTVGREDAAAVPTLELADDSAPALEVVSPASHQPLEQAVKFAITQEMERVRRQIDEQIHGAVEDAVEELIERVTTAALDNLTRPDGEEPGIAPAGAGKRRRKAQKPKI